MFTRNEWNCIFKITNFHENTTYINFKIESISKYFNRVSLFNLFGIFIYQSAFEDKEQKININYKGDIYILQTEYLYFKEELKILKKFSFSIPCYTNVSIPNGTMAPALTEPLSSNNKLAASTSSISPTPSISNTSENNSLKNTNHHVKNANTNNNNKTNLKSTSHTAGILLNGNGNNINNSQKNFGIIENNNNNQKNSLFRRSLTTTCAFQSAFEESIKKACIPLPEPELKKSKKSPSNSSAVKTVLIKSVSGEEDLSDSSKKYINKTKTNIPLAVSKENLSKDFFKKVKTESLHSQPQQQQQHNNNKIYSKNNNINNNNNSSNNLNSIGKLTNGPSSLLSTSSIVCKSIEAKATSATTQPPKSNKTNKLMGPMSDTKQIDSQDFLTISEEEPQPNTQQHSKNSNILQGFIPIDKDFEQAINNTLQIYNNNKKENIKQDQQGEKNEEEILVKLEDLQQMDLPNCNDNNNDRSVNNSDKSIELSDNIVNLNVDNSNIIEDKNINIIAIDNNCGNVDDSDRNIEKVVDSNIVIECDSRNQQSDIEFSQQEIRSTGTTDTTVSASECENNFLEDNFQDSSRTLCHSQENTPNRLINNRSSPKTPVSSSQQPLSQIIGGTPVSSILTPQSIGISSAMGLQKDFKDSEMDDQVLSDMDLLQVLKGLDTTSGGDNLCDLAGNLGLFNDVDVMNYEEIAVPNIKEIDATLDIRNSIEKSHQQMERKCEYLLRRLRKLQSRYMGKHTSEEICGLFEWTNRLVRRKDQHEQIPSLTYEEDKHRPVSATVMRNLLRKIDLVAKAQHSNASDPTLQPLKKYKSNSNRLTSSSSINSNIIGHDGDNSDKKNSISSTKVGSNASMTTIIKLYDEKTTDEIRHVSGLLHSELRQVQCSFDSDATASSSGGESADEMVTYNNQSQHSLSISKRAAWRWARDRSAIESRWTWLCTQISDLEYRKRQHNELYQHIRKTKGAVLFEPRNANCTPTKDNQLNDTVGKISEEISSTVDFTEDINRNDIVSSSDDNNFTINTINNVNGYRSFLPSLNNNNNDSNNIVLKNKVHQIDECGETSITTEDEIDDSWGACRTRAFQRSGFRKRKLLQTANVHTVSKKAARPSTVKCGCQWPFNPCALCTGRPDPTAPRDLPDTMMPTERIALLDSGYHPVLSFSEDVPTNVHIEAILHTPEWQNKLIRSVSKNSKLTGRKSEDRSSVGLGHSRNSGDISSKRPYNKAGQKYRKDPPTSTNKVKKSRKNHDYPSGFSHHSGIAQSPQNSSNSSTKNKNRKSSLMSSSLASGPTVMASNNSGLNLSGSGLNSSTTNSTNGFQSVFAESLLNSFQCDNLDGSSNGILPRSKNASPTPGSTGNHKHERSLERRNRISYDIDNIVIPYSVAASTRVELLPYKEIPTPKWRVIDDDLEDMDMAEEMDMSKSDTDSKLEFIVNKNVTDIDLSKTKFNFNTDNSFMLKPTTTTAKITTASDAIMKNDPDTNIIESQDNFSLDEISSNMNDFDEDISMVAIQSRHERALLEERRKFSTYLKFPWSTRSRANRRIDSRAESSGANTPDPTSPAPHTPSVGGDQESIPSPAAPSTPLAIQGDPNDIDLLNGHRRERKRTVSSKKDKDIFNMSFLLERRSQSPDSREIIPPYEPLKFPIPDDIFEKMLQLMPSINDDDDDDDNDVEDNSNLVSSTVISNTGNILNNSNPESINKKLNGGNNNSSRKNSVSFNLSDTFNENNNNNSSIFSSTSTNINELCKNNNDNNFNNNNINNNSNINNNIIKNKKNNKNIISNKKSGLKIGSKLHEYMILNNKAFLVSISDTDSAESGLEEDPNDPEWKGNLE